MKIIAIDASGLTASVALLEDDILLAEYTVQYKKTHSQTLLPMLEEIRKMTELNLMSVDAIAVAAGPGSFTGLRIGSATAKGIALATGCPIVSVSTLEALACNLIMSDRIVCPIMDARRSQVYTAAYRFKASDPRSREEDRRAEVLLSPCAMGITELAEYLNRQGEAVIFTGDGMPVFRDRLKELLTVPFEMAPPSLARQRAASVGILGRRLYLEGKAEPADEHAPIYLRLSQAERERSDKAREILDQLSFAPADEEHLPQSAEIEKNCFSDPWSEDDLRSAMDNDRCIFLTARVGDEVIGNILLEDIAGEGNISNVAVDPKYRSCRVGTMLMEEVLRLGRERGLKAYTLEVRSNNAPAIRLYEGCGFVREGIRPGFYKHPDDDALIFWLRE